MYFSNIGEYRDMYSGHQQYKYKYSNSVKLNGKGTLKTKPDMAILTLGVITEGKELKTVQEENALKTNSLINRLKAMGINERDIQTQSYNVDIEYDYVDGKQVFRGYRVTNTIVVTIRDINKTGEI
ncbi:MAG: SIMPL domain-containing protein, partial [Clostridium sp.]|nr:SIMPL domain-containing protein [Clostridium sp.]